MAKWTKLKTVAGHTYFNLGLVHYFQIRRYEDKFNVVIDTLATVTTFDTEKKAKQFIEDFIAKYYT